MSQFVAPVTSLVSAVRSVSKTLARERKNQTQVRVGLYTILPLNILYGIYCNKGRSRGNNILRNSVCDEGGKRGAQTKLVVAKNIIDSCTQTSKENNIF